MATTITNPSPSISGYRITLEKITDNPDTSAYFTTIVSCDKLDDKGTLSFPTSVNSMEYVILSETLIALRAVERATKSGDG
jgi:hypothetical protein